MTVAALITGLVALTLVAGTCWRIAREPRRTGHGMAIVVSLVAVWVFLVILMARISVGSNLIDMVILGPTLLVILTAMAAGVSLVFNGLVVIRREGLRIATLVPAVFGCFLLTTVVAAFVAALIVFNGKTTWWGLAAGMALVVIPLGIIVAELVGYTLYAWLYSKIGRVPPAEVVVVLGAGLSGERVTPLLAARIDRGIEVLDKITATGGQPVLVLSGGQGADEAVSEAAAMARYAIEQGVPADRIIEEDTSTTTEENLRNTRDVLAERGYEWSMMAVVTSNFHTLRAASLTRRLGLPATVIGAPTARYYVPAGFLREFTACLVHYRRLNLIAWSVLTALTWAFIGLVAYLSAQQTEVVDAALAMV